MIEKIDSYTIACDTCGTDFTNDEGFNIFLCASDARTAALDEDWTERGEKVFCPECSEKMETGVLSMESFIMGGRTFISADDLILHLETEMPNMNEVVKESVTAERFISLINQFKKMASE